MTLPDGELYRTARHLALPGFGIEQQTSLYKAHVLVIGAGGLGCPAMQSLAAAGVGAITVIDDDIVDLSNIHRQILFASSDVGRVKVEVAAARLRELQPGIDVTAINRRLRPDNAVDLLNSVDLVLDGSDNFSTKYLVADAAEVTGTPLVWGTVLRFHGDVALFHSGPGYRGVGLRDLFPIQPAADSVPDCASAGVLGATTAVVGGLMATLTIAVLAELPGADVGQVLSYEALPPKTTSFQVRADPARPLVSTVQTTYDDEEDSLDSRLGDIVRRIRAGELTPVDIREPHETLLQDLPAAFAPQRLPLSTITEDSDALTFLAHTPGAAVFCASGRRSSAFVDKYSDASVELVDVPGGLPALLRALVSR